MKNTTILMIFLGSGWVLLALFLASGYFYNKVSHNSERFKFSPVTWDNHMQIFNGAIQCSLVNEDLLNRKKTLRQIIFTNIVSRKTSLNGVTYYFNDNADLLESVLEHVQIEKACCPFFKFDISILPFNNGFALQISGSKDALEMIKDFELED